jgi:hypothetical protein
VIKTEVDQVAKPHTGCSRVVEKLGTMPVGALSHRVHLEGDLLVAYEVGLVKLISPFRVFRLFRGHSECLDDDKTVVR